MHGPHYISMSGRLAGLEFFHLSKSMHRRRCASVRKRLCHGRTKDTHKLPLLHRLENIQAVMKATSYANEYVLLSNFEDLFIACDSWFWCRLRSCQVWCCETQDIILSPATTPKPIHTRNTCQILSKDCHITRMYTYSHQAGISPLAKPETSF